MKNFIYIIILTFLSITAFSQNKKSTTSKAESHEKTSYSEKGLINSKKKKKKRKKKKRKNLINLIKQIIVLRQKKRLKRERRLTQLQM